MSRLSEVNFSGISERVPVPFGWPQKEPKGPFWLRCLLSGAVLFAVDAYKRCLQGQALGFLRCYGLVGLFVTLKRSQFQWHFRTRASSFWLAPKGTKRAFLGFCVGYPERFYSPSMLNAYKDRHLVFFGVIVRWDCLSRLNEVNFSGIFERVPVPFGWPQKEPKGPF